MPVDTEGDYIRIRVRDPDDFVKDSFKTVALSEDQGIYSVMGKLKSDPEGNMVIQNYMFKKDKGWTTEKAEKWVKDHKEKKTIENDLEFRGYSKLEIRVDGIKEPHIIGHAALFDVPYPIAWFQESVERGAFAQSIEEDDIRMLWNHDPNYVLGRNKSGTLKLKEDDKGLWFDAIAPDTQWAKDHMITIKRGDVTQNSIGFIVVDEEWKNNKEERILKKVQLFDVSPVTYAANPQTEVFVRNGWNVYRFRSPFIVSMTPLNPTAFLINNSPKVNEDDKANPPLVVPNEPLIDPHKWTDIQNKLRRFQK